MISDVEAEMSWWACFDKAEAAPRKKPQSAPTAPASVMLQARAANVGRNDPCPCGSGKKFKKCCGGLDAAGISFRTGSHGENRTARCDRASGFSQRPATDGRISTCLARSQTHV